MRYLFLFVFFLVGCSAPRTKESSYLVAQYLEPSASLSSSKSVSTQAQRGSCIVFLDAGHGGYDRGAASFHKRLQEKNLTLETARRVEFLLLAKGYRIFMSRRQDVFVALSERVQMAAKKRANTFVSIHYNFAKNLKIQGSEVFYFSNVKQPVRTKLSKALGASILKKLTESLPTPSRGVKSGNFCVIRETTMPAVLVEVAFLSNLNDVRLLLDVSYRNKIALAIAEGIEDYFCNKKDGGKYPRRELNARPVA